MRSKELSQTPSVSPNELTMDILQKNVENWFGPIAALNKDERPNSLNQAWSELMTHQRPDILADSSIYLKAIGGTFLSSLRIERETLVSTPSTFILRDPKNAQKEDRWVVVAKTDQEVVAQNTSSKIRTAIPVKCVLPGLRRGANIRTMNIALSHDFVLVESFPNANVFFPKDLARASRDLLGWKVKVQRRLSKLSIYRRYDISSPNTCYLAFYSNVPYAATDILLSVTGLGDEDAKAFALWYNSTFNILQILLERVETRAAYLEVPVFVAKKLKVLDARKIPAQDRETLAGVFDQICNVPQQSLTKQLTEHHPERMKMDLAIARALGLESEHVESYLRSLQSTVGNEIAGLKHMMENE
jgi:hypothetical protein